MTATERERERKSNLMWVERQDFVWETEQMQVTREKQQQPQNIKEVHGNGARGS